MRHTRFPYCYCYTWAQFDEHRLKNISNDAVRLSLDLPAQYSKIFDHLVRDEHPREEAVAQSLTRQSSREGCFTKLQIYYRKKNKKTSQNYVTPDTKFGHTYRATGGRVPKMLRVGRPNAPPSGGPKGRIPRDERAPGEAKSIRQASGAVDPRSRPT